MAVQTYRQQCKQMNNFVTNLVTITTHYSNKLAYYPLAELWNIVCSTTKTDS